MKYTPETIPNRNIQDTCETTHGYLTVRVLGKKILQHRMVMEGILGRKLERKEHVHHKNGDRKDNRPENLELWQGAGKKDPSGVRVIDAARNLLNQLSAEDRAMLFSEIKV
ncbi:HNH endonuclease [Propionivibrio sp.]|uniref:HNH endonuclease n=1 Tax=Propionivibrio sp. TaxID=2212460 RepID=UPI003BF066C1